MAVAESFNIDLLIDQLKDCFDDETDEKDISMDDYLKSYRHLCLFFDLLGSVFGFVVKDITDKVKILEGYRDGPTKDNYNTVETMVKFETTSGLTSKKSNPPNGSRTLLRLHRAMEFIALFIKQTVESDDKLSHIAYQSYQDTLAKYHPWIIRKGVGLAVYTLPSREHLLKDICSETTEAATKLQNLQIQIELIYQSVQKVYVDYEILNLP